MFGLYMLGYALFTAWGVMMINTTSKERKEAYTNFKNEMIADIASIRNK